MSNAESNIDLDQELDTTVVAAEEASTEEQPKEKNPLSAIQVSLPATINSREDFDKVLEAHHVWLESVLNPAKKIGGGRANLRGADLSGWDLTGVNLSGATLKEVKLIGAKLVKANLTAADLSFADLQGADLTGARLKRAILTRADLRDANLEDADLSNAKTDYTKFKADSATEDTVAEVVEPIEEQSNADATLDDSDAAIPFSDVQYDHCETQH